MVHSRPIIEVVSQCFRDNHVYRPPFLLERYLASLGCHLFNYVNYRTEILMDGPYPANYRAPMVAAAPSGYCKSKFMKFLYHKHGLLNRPEIPCSVRGTFTPQSWVGTRLRREDEDADPSAVFARFRTGMVAAEEYARLVDLMNGDGREPEEVYLLQALDTPFVSKDHSLGVVEHHGVCTTVYAAMRPPAFAIKMDSGLARRVIWDLQLPGPQEFLLLDQERRKGKEEPPIQPFGHYRSLVQAELTHILQTLPETIPRTLDLSEVSDWCQAHRQPHFIAEILERVALGLSVVRGDFPRIPVDDLVAGVLSTEVRNRRILKVDCRAYAVRACVRSWDALFDRKEPFARMPEQELMRFLMDYYQLSLVEARGAQANAVALGLVELSDGDVVAPPAGPLEEESV